jgi:hypothetical protein
MSAFWVDADYDRGHASDGTSRYAAYVRRGSWESYTDDYQAAELAVFAWERATPPVMAPGYVRRHPRVRAATLERSYWDGSLIARVDLITSQHQGLRRLLGWADWPVERRFAAEGWYEPGDEDLARGPYLLCTASLRFAVPCEGLPLPPCGDSPEGLTEACVASVAALLTSLNAVTLPVIEQIEAS